MEIPTQRNQDGHDFCSPNINHPFDYYRVQKDFVKKYFGRKGIMGSSAALPSAEVGMDGTQASRDVSAMPKEQQLTYLKISAY